MSERWKVVIVGGGFGGLAAARALKSKPVDVTLIDRRNYHLFQPLLYQVATGSLSPGEIAAPIRSVPKKSSPKIPGRNQILAVRRKGQGIDLGNMTVEIGKKLFSGGDVPELNIMSPGARRSGHRLAIGRNRNRRARINVAAEAM